MQYEEVYEKTKEIIADYLRVKQEEILPETNLVDELCADSIALVELSFRFSDAFGIPMIEGTPDLFIIKNLVDHIMEEIKKL